MTATRTYRLGTAPGGIPFLGNALQIFRNPLTFLPDLRHRGDLVRLKLGRETVYMAVTHDVVQEVLHNPRVFDKGGEFIEKMRLLLGDGVGTCSATTHKRQRRFIQPAFQKAKLERYSTVMQERVGELVDSWHDGQRIDVGTELSKLTARVTAQAMFSSDIGAEAIAEVQRCFPVVWKGIYRRMILPVPLMHSAPTKSNKAYHEALAGLERVISEMVAAYRADPRKDRDDILSILLSAKDEETGEGLTDEGVRDELMTILAAGVETPASGLTWAFYLLGQNPDVERELLEEVDEVLGGRTAGFDDVASLPYTTRVATEALRMYPPVWFITRRTTQDTTLAGHPIPGGTSILFSPYALHRDPDLFHDPNEFIPDRWLPENVRKLPKNAPIMFSGGSRKCLGDVLANHEMTIALASIVARYRLRPVPGHTIRPVAKAELTTGPLPMTVEGRG
ncbi:cytochrome P450 [Allokutzneria multivorans]|uniref:Cytochrome P450 n=1 Tax=Allokutzneria multivorans TaxID=1142134 RepID=A0ABP7T3Z5_9PSEU